MYEFPGSLSLCERTLPGTVLMFYFMQFFVVVLSITTDYHRLQGLRHTQINPDVLTLVSVNNIVQQVAQGLTYRSNVQSYFVGGIVVVPARNAF